MIIALRAWFAPSPQPLFPAGEEGLVTFLIKLRLVIHRMPPLWRGHAALVSHEIRAVLFGAGGFHGDDAGCRRGIREFLSP